MRPSFPLPIAVTFSVAILCAATAPGHAQDPRVVVSWGSSCPSVVRDQAFNGPGPYSLWIGCTNLTAADRNVGQEVTLYTNSSIADAWRFDDSGCQTSARVTINDLSPTKACPTMNEFNALAITEAVYEPTHQRLRIRMARTYDPSLPLPGTTYTLWNLVFDHSHSAAGTDLDPSTCDNAGQPVTLSIADANDPDDPSFLLTESGVFEYFHFTDPADQSVTWNGDPPVATQATTWGRLKSEYR